MKPTGKCVVPSHYSTSLWHSITWLGANSLFLDCPYREREEWTIFATFWVFMEGSRRACLRDWLLSHLSYITAGTRCTLDAWRPLRTKKSGAGCCWFRVPTVQQKDATGNKRLWALEIRNQQIHPIRNLHAQIQRRYSHKKVLRSLPGNINRHDWIMKKQKSEQTYN